MRQVRECDFCGEGAGGVYEPLPASIDPDGPRLLLCEGCHGRLAAVVEPLLDRLDVDAAGDGFGTDAAAGDASDGTAGGASDRSTGDADGTTAGAAVDAAAGDAGGGDDRTDGADSAVDGETAANATASGGAGAPASGGVDAGGRSGEEREGTPRGYRKVMRFLENRTFPVEREEAERLAAEAYDLDEETVGAAIDHAVKYGRLREVRGELKR